MTRNQIVFTVYLLQYLAYLFLCTTWNIYNNELSIINFNISPYNIETKISFDSYLERVRSINLSYCVSSSCVCPGGRGLVVVTGLGPLCYFNHIHTTYFSFTFFEIPYKVCLMISFHY